MSEIHDQGLTYSMGIQSTEKSLNSSQNMDAPKRCKGVSQKRKGIQSDGSLFSRPFTRSQNKLMSSEQPTQQKLSCKGDVLQNDSEQIASLNVSTLSHEIGEPPDYLRKTDVKSKVDTMDLQPAEERIHSNSSHSENDCSQNVGLDGMNSDNSLLQKIYSKHGDITKGCDLKSEEFRSSCFHGICGVIQKLQESSIDDLNSDDVTELYSSIKDAENMKFDVNWLHQRVVEIDASVKSRDKLKEVEETQRTFTSQRENLQKRIQMNKLEATKLDHEIEMLKQEQAVKESRHDELKAMTEDIESSYNALPKYLIDWFL